MKTTVTEYSIPASENSTLTPKSVKASFGFEEKPSVVIYNCRKSEKWCGDEKDQRLCWFSSTAGS